MSAIKERAENIRAFAQDLLDNGHLFGAQIGNVMAIRDEADRLLILGLSEQKAFRDGWWASGTGYNADGDHLGPVNAWRAYEKGWRPGDPSARDEEKE